MPNPLADATSAVLEILLPLESQNRIRVIHAALTLLGENPNVKLGKADNSGAASGIDDEESLSDLHQVGRAWAKKNKLSDDHLNQIFHIDQSNARPISLPGLTKKKNEQTVNTYLIQGVANFLKTGNASFSDEEARKLCEHFGCYDTKHHAKILRTFGNKVTGSKATGWILTAPGLMAAADLIKQVPNND